MCLSVCLFTVGSQCDYYPWCLWPHHTGTPPALLCTGTPLSVQGSPGSQPPLVVTSGGLEWRPVQTCSLEDAPDVDTWWLATKTCMVGEWEVNVLLDYFLVTARTRSDHKKHLTDHSQPEAFVCPQEGLCMMSLPVWLPGPMFLPGDLWGSTWTKTPWTDTPLERPSRQRPPDRDPRTVKSPVRILLEYIPVLNVFVLKWQEFLHYNSEEIGEPAATALRKYMN